MKGARGSEFEFLSIAELSKAMQARRISAAELLEHTIARIEVLDGVTGPLTGPR
jgi:amidase